MSAHDFLTKYPGRPKAVVYDGVRWQKAGKRGENRYAKDRGLTFRARPRGPGVWRLTVERDIDRAVLLSRLVAGLNEAKLAACLFARKLRGALTPDTAAAWGDT